MRSSALPFARSSVPRLRRARATAAKSGVAELKPQLPSFIGSQWPRRLAVFPYTRCPPLLLRRTWPSARNEFTGGRIRAFSTRSASQLAREVLSKCSTGSPLLSLDVLDRPSLLSDSFDKSERVELQRVRELSENGQYTEAREQLKVLLQAEEQLSPPLLLSIGYCELQLSNWESAIAYLDRLLETRQDILAAYQFKSFALVKLGLATRAVECCKRAIDLDDRYVPCNFLLGAALLEMKKMAEAIVYLSKTVLIDVQHIHGYLLLGKAYMATEEYSLALESFSALLEIFRDNKEALLGRARCLVSLNRYGEALEAFDLLLKHHPDHMEGWLGKSVCYELRKEYSNALESVNHVLTIKSTKDRIGPLLYKARYLYSLKDYNTCIDICDEALKKDPYNINVLNQKSLALHELGRHEEAKLCSESANQYRTQFIQSLCQLGTSLLNETDYLSALEIFEFALSVDEESIELYIGRAKALCALDRPEEALRDLLLISRSHPDEAFHWYELGNFLLQIGNVQQALNVYHKAVELEPDNLKRLKEAVCCLQNAGHEEKAVSFLEQILQLESSKK